MECGISGYGNIVSCAGKNQRDARSEEGAHTPDFGAWLFPNMPIEQRHMRRLANPPPTASPGPPLGGTKIESIPVGDNGGLWMDVKDSACPLAGRAFEGLRAASPKRSPTGRTLRTAPSPCTQRMDIVDCADTVVSVRCCNWGPNSNMKIMDRRYGDTKEPGSVWNQNVPARTHCSLILGRTRTPGRCQSHHESQFSFRTIHPTVGTKSPHQYLGDFVPKMIHPALCCSSRPPNHWGFALLSLTWNGTRAPARLRTGTQNTLGP